MGLLSANNLAKSYGGRSVVKDVSIEVERGQIVGLLGPNGCGKTTCFYMIVGIVPADHGQVSIDGEEITALPMHGRARKGIGYLPQEASIFRKLTVTENIFSILETRADLSRAQRKEKLEQLLDEFHIGHIRDSKGMALSGGERRRVDGGQVLQDNVHRDLLGRRGLAAMHRLMVGSHGDGPAGGVPGQAFKGRDDLFLGRPAAGLLDGLLVRALQSGPCHIGAVCRIVGVALVVLVNARHELFLHRGGGGDKISRGCARRRNDSVRHRFPDVLKHLLAG